MTVEDPFVIDMETDKALVIVHPGDWSSEDILKFLVKYTVYKYYNPKKEILVFSPEFPKELLDFLKKRKIKIKLENPLGKVQIRNFSIKMDLDNLIRDSLEKVQDDLLRKILLVGEGLGKLGFSWDFDKDNGLVLRKGKNIIKIVQVVLKFQNFDVDKILETIKKLVNL